MLLGLVSLAPTSHKNHWLHHLVFQFLPPVTLPQAPQSCAQAHQHLLELTLHDLEGGGFPRKICNLYLLLFSLVRFLAWKKYPVVSDTLLSSPHPWNPQECSSTASGTLQRQSRFYIPVSKPWAKTPEGGKERDLISNTETFWHVSLSPPAGTHAAQPSPSPNADALPKPPKTRKDETPTNKTTTKHPQAKLHWSIRSTRRQPVLFIFICYESLFCQESLKAVQAVNEFHRS